MTDRQPDETRHVVLNLSAEENRTLYDLLVTAMEDGWDSDEIESIAEKSRRQL